MEPSKPGTPKAGTSRSRKNSESRSRSGSTSTLTAATQELQGEANRMKAIAATAAAKAHQKKMTDYVGSPGRTQGRGQGQGPSSSGAGELPSGPCGSAAAPTAMVAGAATGGEASPGQPTISDEISAIQDKLRSLRDQ